MRPPVKMNAIDQEHLQELYNASGVARDELPYSPAFDTLVQGFQDRTFKNAHPEQVFAAIVKYVRSSSNSATEAVADALNEDQQKQLKAVLSRHLSGGKLLPYSDEFNAARNEFNRAAGTDLSEQDFWRSVLRALGAKRRPPARKKVAAAKAEDEDDGE